MRVHHPATRLLAGLGLLAFLAPPAQAQTTLGVRGGVSVSSVDRGVSGTFDDSNRTGFAGGIFVDVNGSSPLGFQLGAEYSQRGADLDIDDTIRDLSLNYLEIPAVLKLGIPLGIAKPSLLGGVALGFRTSCDYSSGDCDEEITSTEWAGLLGADLAIYLGGLSVWVDGRYHFGLSNLSDAFDVDELKNRAWTFQAGLGFPMGR